MGRLSQISSGARFGVIVVLGLTSAFVVLAVASCEAYWTMRGLVGSSDRVSHSRLIIDRLEHLRLALNDAETRERDYLINGDQDNLELYQAVRGGIGEEIHQLATLLTRDDVGQQQRLSNLKPLIDARLTSLDNSVAVRQQVGVQSAMEMVRSSSRRSVMDDIRRRIDDMLDEENLLVSDYRLNQKLTTKPAIHLAVGGGVAGFVLLFVTLFYTFRGFKLLRTRLVDLSHSDTLAQTQCRLMEAVLENIDEGVVILDRDMKVVQSNAAAEKLLQVSRSQVLEKLTAEIEPSLAGDGLRLALGRLPGTLSDGGDLETTQPGISRFDARDRLAIAATTRVIRDEVGTLQGGVLLFRDDKARTRMERQLKAKETSLIELFDHGLEAACIASLEDALCMRVNERFLRLFGYSRGEILGQTIEDANFCASPAGLREALERVRITGAVYDQLLRFCTKAGRTFEARLSALPVEVGGKACIMFALQNITWPKLEWRSSRSSWLLRRLVQS